jgi:hypothetical protein
MGHIITALGTAKETIVLAMGMATKTLVSLQIRFAVLAAEVIIKIAFGLAHILGRQCLAEMTKIGAMLGAILSV